MMGKTAIVCLAAIALVLPASVDAMDKTCTINGVGTTCTETLAKGDKFTLDCTGVADKTMPATLLSATTAAAMVCYETTARTTYDAACTKEATLDSLKTKNITGVASTNAASGLSITNTDYKETTDLILTGSCYLNDKSKYGYFNITFSKVTTDGGSSASGLSVSVAALAAAFIGTMA